MSQFIIYYDDIQEGLWFQELHPKFSNAELKKIPGRKADIEKENLSNDLKYDKPDIILKDGTKTILVVERTIEVPSGHNVGQRFGRLAAGAENQIPVVYFGPYAAFKHGGDTAGPRYMNLRLFYALNKLSNIYQSAITTINWPVDSDYEIIKNSTKDIKMKEYIKLFLDYYLQNGMDGINQFIMNSDFQLNQQKEIDQFIVDEIKNPSQYDTPPTSVSILPVSEFEKKYNQKLDPIQSFDEVVLYNVGMTNVRSDPYTGMTILYRYLYTTEVNSNRALILYFPNISVESWNATNTNRKDYRIFTNFSNGILLKDGFQLNK